MQGIRVSWEGPSLEEKNEHIRIPGSLPNKDDHEINESSVSPGA